MYSRTAYFYPRPPRGGRPSDDGSYLTLDSFLSTPSARRATHSCVSLLAGRQISIHALREEGDCSSLPFRRMQPTFLSTPSARRATVQPFAVGHDGINFYPRPPRGGRRQKSASRFRGQPISIHALREEGDYMALKANGGDQDFYPRPPRGGRLPQGFNAFRGNNFYPRPPRGGRLRREVPAHLRGGISIHALREEGDDIRKSRRDTPKRFLSTPSARRATRPDYQMRQTMEFLSTPSARRATTGAIYLWYTLPQYFYPRPPRGGRQQKQRQNLYFQTNYTTFCTNLEEP